MQCQVLCVLFRILNIKINFEFTSFMQAQCWDVCVYVCLLETAMCWRKRVKEQSAQLIVHVCLIPFALTCFMCVVIVLKLVNLPMNWLETKHRLPLLWSILSPLVNRFHHFYHNHREMDVVANTTVYWNLCCTRAIIIWTQIGHVSNIS